MHPALGAWSLSHWKPEKSPTCMTDPIWPLASILPRLFTAFTLLNFYAIICPQPSPPPLESIPSYCIVTVSFCVDRRKMFREPLFTIGDGSRLLFSWRTSKEHYAYLAWMRVVVLIVGSSNSSAGVSGSSPRSSSPILPQVYSKWNEPRKDP